MLQILSKKVAILIKFRLGIYIEKSNKTQTKEGES